MPTRGERAPSRGIIVGMRKRGSLLAVLLVAGACARFGAAEDPTPAADAGSDAPTPAPTPTPPRDATDDRSVATDANDGAMREEFESGCGTWAPTGGTQDPQAPHGGRYACTVCSPNGKPFVQREFSVEGPTSYLSVFVRTTTLGGSPSEAVVRVSAFFPDTSDAQGRSSEVNVSTTAGMWKEGQLNTLLSMPAIGKSGLVFIESTTTGSCLSVDDFRLVQP